MHDCSRFDSALVPLDSNFDASSSRPCVLFFRSSALATMFPFSFLELPVAPRTNDFHTTLTTENEQHSYCSTAPNCPSHHSSNNRPAPSAFLRTLTSLGDFRSSLSITILSLGASSVSALSSASPSRSHISASERLQRHRECAGRTTVVGETGT